jgi:hypothetical protein
MLSVINPTTKRFILTFVVLRELLVKIFYMKLLLLKITAWACSVFFIIMGLAYLISSVVGGLLIILAALLINPIIYGYTKKYAAKYKFNLKPWLSSLVALCLIIIGIGSVTSTDSYKKNIAETDKIDAEKVAQKKLEDDKKKEELATTDKANQEAKAKADEQKRTEDEAKKRAEEDKKKAEELAKANRTPAQKVADLSGEVFKEKGFTSNLAESTAILSYDSSQGAFWDDKHYLESMLKDFVKFGREAVKVDKVDTIEVEYKAKLVDTFGKEKDGNLMSIGMSKDDFLKYNFDNIQGDLFYNSVSKNAYIFILPSTRTKIDFSKVKVYL